MTSIQIDRTDGLSSSVAIKGPCRAATTANITLSGEQTIDGVAVVTDDRVLVKDQTTASENGIYVVDTGAWRRAKDFSRTNDVKSGTQVFVVSGTAHASTQFALTTLGEILVGTTNLTFEQSSIGYSDLAEMATVVETRTALKALDTTTKTVAFLKESGREGVFIWRAGDYSTLIAADTLEGLYVKATAIAAASGAWVRQRNDLNVNVKWFGAVCDNATDDAAAINAAILALPVTGGTVFIPGQCAVGSTITCGNGTSSVLSTRYGIRLKGTVLPNFMKDGSHPFGIASGLRWIGGATADPVVKFAGPLIGWALENMVIDGSLLADTGMYVTSCSMGVTQNLTFRNCKYSYTLNCYSSTAGYTPDISANNDVIRGGNIVIAIPNITGAVGMNISGVADGSASTCFMNLDTVRIYLSSTHVCYGLIWGVADANSIRNTLIIASSAVQAGTYGVIYDYTQNGVFPSSILMDHLDCGWMIPVSQQMINSGSSAGASAPNLLKNLIEVNGGRYPSGMTNMITDCTDNRMISYLATDFTGTDVATAQPVFGAAQDAVLLKATRNYRFRAVYNITRAAGTTSHTTGVLFGGTATFINVDGVVRASNPTGNALSAVSEITFAVATETVVTAANTSATENVRVEMEGIIRTNAAGTLIPQFKYSAAPGGAPTVKRGSFFEIWPIGEGGQAWTGDWS